MEATKKQLKIASILVFIFTGLSVFYAVTALIFEEIGANVPAGAPENTTLIAEIILGAVTLLLVLPRIYIGIRGLKEVKNPTKGKGHIAVAIVFTILSAVSIAVPVINLVNRGDVFDNVVSISTLVVETLVYLDYARYAWELQKAA